MLYSQIFQYLLKREDVAELTIEDPSEAFEDLRDKEDMKLLQRHHVFDLDLDKLIPINREWYQATKQKWKLADVSPVSFLQPWQATLTCSLVLVLIFTSQI